jgi:hypothetical protein
VSAIGPASRFVCSPEHFQRIAGSPLLAPALQIARSVNALRALKTATLPAELPERLKLRQQTNILLHLGATLYEALETLDQVGPEFSQLDSFREHLLPLRRAKDWKQFKEKILWPVRKSVAFHFDADVLPRAFSTFKFEPTVFLSRGTSGSFETWYELADHGLIPSAFAEGDYDDFLTNYRRFLNDSLVYMGYYCSAADIVLEDVARRLGFAEEHYDPK